MCGGPVSSFVPKSVKVNLGHPTLLSLKTSDGSRGNLKTIHRVRIDPRVQEANMSWTSSGQLLCQDGIYCHIKLTRRRPLRALTFLNNCIYKHVGFCAV